MMPLTAPARDMAGNRAVTDLQAMAARPAPGAKAIFFVACFALEAVVFAVLPLSARFPVGRLLEWQGGLTAVLLVAVLLVRRSEAGRKYWTLLYAFFAAAMAVLLSTLFGGRLLEALPVVPVSPAGIAVAKLAESLWRVTVILLLMVAGGVDLRSIYLRKGRLGQGLTVGLAGFALCAALAFVPLASQEGGLRRLLSLSPWIATFVLANGFSEELLFRGLFLKRYEPFLGKRLSNLLTAAAFTLLHLQVLYVSQAVVFPLVLFPLALVWGGLMQKTGSLWGSALFHAGADCVIIFGVYASL